MFVHFFVGKEGTPAFCPDGPIDDRTERKPHDAKVFVAVPRRSNNDFVDCLQKRGVISDLGYSSWVFVERLGIGHLLEHLVHLHQELWIIIDHSLKLFD